MRRVSRAFVFVALVCATAWPGCMDREPAPVCPVPTELAKNDFMPAGFDGVDILMVVDNSGTMASEQETLATSILTLVNSLVSPLPDWEFGAAADVRFAVISTDMGLQAGGEPYDPDLGWPDMGVCNGDGDDGLFRTYGTDKVVSLDPGDIPCDVTAAQCPAGWTCTATEEDETGVCAAGGDGTEVACPELAGDWAATSGDDQNGDLPLQVACLSALGTVGCGFEQQLEAAAQSLTKPSQEGFVRESSLLAIIVVSDEEDCSIENGEGIAGAEEMDSNRRNLVCGNNEQYLYDLEHYFDAYSSLKGEKANAVLFAAITGVPMVPECQGTGDAIDGCLDRPDMKNVEYYDEEKKYYLFEPACTSASTSASPGRRYVELARRFETMGYVYSICNDDWSPAMAEIARLIASKISGTCYDKPLDWDPETRQARCDVVVELIDRDGCPQELEGSGSEPESFEDDEGEEHTRVLCTIPKISAPKSCAEMDTPPTEVGWYYCENDAAAVAQSPDLCQYVVQLTEGTEELVRGSAISIQCMQQFSFEDDNCREDSEEVCGDGVDNDGNGVYDCTADLDGDGAHFAEPACCPMAVGDEGRCVIEDAAFEICPGTSPAEPSDSCRAAADLLGCNLP